MLESLSQVFPPSVEEAERESRRDQQDDENGDDGNHKPRFSEDAVVLERLAARRDAARMGARGRDEMGRVHDEGHLIRRKNFSIKFAVSSVKI